MKSATFRVISTVIALIISSLIVLALSHAGKETKGPIENAMIYTGKVVKDIEKKLIVEQRSEKREDKLKWFNNYKTSKKSLLKPDRVLLGAFDDKMKESFGSIIALEDSIHTTFPLIHIYAAWGSKSAEEFPSGQVEDIIGLGSLPVITWEPWLNDFNADMYPGGVAPQDPNIHGMKDIASGLYDSYVREWADAAKKVNKPFFLRFGHEMNDGYRYPWGPQNNTPDDFIAAWQHVYAIFAKQGANKVIWVWSPHPAYDFKDFYPGDTYVDYIGVGVLNYGTIAAWSKWWSFSDIVGKFYDSVSSYKKPVMITEFGSLAVGGDRVAWYADALDSLPQRYPLIRSVLFFHFSKDNTTTQQTLNWYFKNDHAVSAAINSKVTKWNTIKK